MFVLHLLILNISCEEIKYSWVLMCAVDLNIIFLSFAKVMFTVIYTQIVVLKNSIKFKLIEAKNPISERP